MGGIIKFALKENNKVKSINLHTSYLLSRFSGLDELFNNITMEELDNEEFEPSDNFDPTDYGVLFVDRDKRTILNVNSFCSIGKIMVARIKNNMTEYQDLDYRAFDEKKYNSNPNNDMVFVDPRTNPDSNVKVFYTIQNSLNVDNRDVILYGKNKYNNEVEVIESLKFQDSIKLSKHLIDCQEKMKDEYSLMGIQFLSRNWNIINSNYENSQKENEYINEFLKVYNFI